MKRRLNNSMRTLLLQRADEAIYPKKETKAFEDAYAKAAPLVTETVAKKYPKAEMLVLKKWGVSRQDQCINLQYPNGVVERFIFNELNEAPFVPDVYGCSGRIYSTEQKTADAVEKWKDTKVALDKEKKERHEAYRALINGSYYVEDVAAVWPEAEALLPNVGALIPLNDEARAKIKADLKEQNK